MRSSWKFLSVLVLAILLIGCLFAYYSTRDSTTPANQQNKSEQVLVDTSLLQTALKLAPLATTPGEQVQARDARRLADHELDLTFAAALREAQAEAAVASAASDPLRQLNDQVAKLKDRVEADKKRVKDLNNSDSAALDFAQAQLDLDQDELDDTQQDIAIQDGGKRARLQRVLEEHEASEKVADQSISFASCCTTSCRTRPDAAGAIQHA
jgi:hypothetical protein